MLVDLQNLNIRAVIIQKSRDKIRMTLEYPNTADFRRKVQNALADLLRSDTSLADETIPSTISAAEVKEHE